MHDDMLGEEIQVGNYVAVAKGTAIRLLRVCKLTPKMIVVEYFTPRRRTRKTFHLYGKDVIQVKSEAVFRLALSE